MSEERHFYKRTKTSTGYLLFYVVYGIVNGQRVPVAGGITLERAS